MDVIIGVDGGGTKTNLVALNAATGVEVARATTGSINVYFGGLEKAAANMQQALELGTRTLMMADGKVVLDVKGEERAGLTVEALLSRFREGTGKHLDNDRMLLSE